MEVPARAVPWAGCFNYHPFIFAGTDSICQISLELEESDGLLPSGLPFWKNYLTKAFTFSLNQITELNWNSYVHEILAHFNAFRSLWLLEGSILLLKFPTGRLSSRRLLLLLVHEPNGFSFC